MSLCLGHPWLCADVCNQDKVHAAARPRRECCGQKFPKHLRYIVPIYEQVIQPYSLFIREPTNAPRKVARDACGSSTCCFGRGVSQTSTIQNLQPVPSLPEPFDHRHINAIRCGIADDETHLRWWGTNPPQGFPCLRHIEEVASHHVVVSLLAATFQTHGRKFAAHRDNLIANRCKFWRFQNLVEIHRFWRDVLGAGAHQMPPHCFLKITPAANLAHERHLQPRGVSVVVIVRVRRRRDNQRGPAIRHSRTLASIVQRAASPAAWPGAP